MFQRVHLGALAVLALGLVVAACAKIPPAGMARGKHLYDTCVPCHGKKGGGQQAIGAPPIAGLAEWYVKEQLTKFKNGIRGAHPDDAEGLRMRPMARSLNREGDVESVAAYVASLPRVAQVASLSGGDATTGQAKFVVCTACHGAGGEGNEGLRAPSLNDKADWYMLTQLHKYKSGLRGAHPEDTFGATMRAISTTLTNEQDMLDVLAYIQTLSK